PTPLVFFSTTSSLNLIMPGRSSATFPSILIPWRVKPCRRCANFCELSSNALDGIQPTLRHVPPRNSRSTQATFIPSCAARMAATYPPGPAPMTMRSKLVCSDIRARFYAQPAAWSALLTMCSQHLAHDLHRAHALLPRDVQM